MSVMLGTEIEPIDGADYEIRHHDEHSWWYIKDSERHWVHSTVDHRFYDHEGFPRQAQDFEIGDIIRHRDGDFEVVESGQLYRVGTTRVEVLMPRIHLYWANGFLSLSSKL